uniref:Uncharacterized protein n=1 Tax=Anguilla anguilla TaxID=7936 RepID=A0A0E9Q0R2_ANGAN
MNQHTRQQHNPYCTQDNSFKAADRLPCCRHSTPASLQNAITVKFKGQRSYAQSCKQIRDRTLTARFTQHRTPPSPNRGFHVKLLKTWV